MGRQSCGEDSDFLSQQPDLWKLWLSKQRGKKPQRKVLDLPRVRLHA